MIVQHDDLADGAGILELQDGLLLDTEDDNIFPAHAHGARPLPHCFECILDLTHHQTRTVHR